VYAQVDDASAQAGRIVITAAKRFGTRGVGIDIDPAQIREARENAVKAGVADKVKFLHVHKLARPQTYAKRLKIFARGSELAAGEALTRSKSRLALTRIRMLRSSKPRSKLTVPRSRSSLPTSRSSPLRFAARSRPEDRPALAGRNRLRSRPL
jgi:hypothetical protein